MKTIILQLKKHGQLAAFCLVCACILLSVLLLPREQNFKGPEQLSFFQSRQVFMTSLLP